MEVVRPSGSSSDCSGSCSCLQEILVVAEIVVAFPLDTVRHNSDVAPEAFPCRAAVVESVVAARQMILPKNRRNV